MSTETPLYLRVAENLRARIESGELAPGARLPSVADISKEYGGSNSVATSAYRLLVEEGLVVSRHGAGHYVRSHDTPELLVRQHRRRSEDSPFAEGAAKQGAVGTWRHESTTEKAAELVAVRLGLNAGAPVMHSRITRA